jgi:hypothetical protein
MAGMDTIAARDTIGITRCNAVNLELRPDL